MPNLNDFSLFVSKSAIELACARADLPPENRNYRIEDFANVRSRKRAWTPVIWSFPVKQLPSLEGLGVGGLIDNLTWWLIIFGHVMLSSPYKIWSVPLCTRRKNKCTKEMRSKLRLFSLYSRRRFFRFIIIFKIFNNLSCPQQRLGIFTLWITLRNRELCDKKNCTYT